MSSRTFISGLAASLTVVALSIPAFANSQSMASEGAARRAQPPGGNCPFHKTAASFAQTVGKGGGQVGNVPLTAPTATRN